MRALLLLICPVALFFFAGFHLVFSVYLLKEAVKYKDKTVLYTGLITLGLFYDALMLALGSILKPGSRFEKLSKARFVSHGALIPLLFPICAEALKLEKKYKAVVWLGTGILMILGAAEGLASDMELKEVADVYRYTAGEKTPKWAKGVSSLLSFGTVLPLMGVGAYKWAKSKNPFLFLAGFIMFAFSAIGPATGNADLIFFISMFGEVGMVSFLKVFADKARKN